MAKRFILLKPKPLYQGNGFCNLDVKKETESRVGQVILGLEWIWHLDLISFSSGMN